MSRARRRTHIARCNLENELSFEMGEQSRAAAHSVSRRFWPLATARVAALGLPYLMLVCGCGESGPRTIEIRGTVTTGGKTLEGGTITFKPTNVPDGGARRPAIGQIESDGSYTLSTFTHGDGALPGEYAVVITSLVGAPPLTVWEENPPKRKSRIPLKYNRADTSGLTASIPADAKGRLTLDFQAD